MVTGENALNENYMEKWPITPGKTPPPMYFTDILQILCRNHLYNHKIE